MAKKRIIIITSIVLIIVIITAILWNSIGADNYADLFARPDIAEPINYEADFSTEKYPLSPENHAGEGYIKKAETEFLELYVGKLLFINNEGKEEEGNYCYDVAVYDKRNGTLWNGIVRDSDIFPNRTQALEMQSLVYFSYYNIKKNDNIEYDTNTLKEMIRRAPASTSTETSSEEETDSEEETSSVEETASEAETSSAEETASEAETSSAEETASEAETSSVEETASEAETSSVEETSQDDDENDDDETNENPQQEESNDTNPSSVDIIDITNGFRISYFFGNLNFGFSVDFKVSGDKFDVVVPEELIISGDSSKLEKSRLDIENYCTLYENQIKSMLSDDDYRTKYKGQNQSTIKIQLDNLAKFLLNLKQSVRAGGLPKDIYENIQRAYGDLLGFLRNGGFETQLAEIENIMAEMEVLVKYVTEQINSGLVQLSVMPFFGAQKNTEEGYVFYPDGSGAISYFNTVRPGQVSNFSQDVYSNHNNSIRIYGGWNWDDTERMEKFTNIRMPVFGIKRENSAFLAIIAEGDSDASIYYEPSNRHRVISRISSTFRIRSKMAKSAEDGKNTYFIDADMIIQPRRVRYVMLDTEQADYSGMAVRYREHLEKYGMLGKSKYMDSDVPPLFLDLFMGFSSNNNSVNAIYHNMTTFEQAKDILTDFKSRGIDYINVNLKGWSDAGFYRVEPDYKLNPEKKLGGKSDLEELLSYAQGSNINVALETGAVFADKEDLTVSDLDLATTKGYGNFTLSFDDYYMFNPLVLFHRITGTGGIAEKIAGYNAQALTLSYEGVQLYNDYNKRAMVTRNEMMSYMQEMAKITREKTEYLNMENINIYLAGSVDWIKDLTEYDSKYFFTDAQVPFYQMVLHGSIPYTGENAYNLMYDATNQRLKYIEYGYMPYYLLTNDDTDKYKRYISFLLSNKAEVWAEPAEQEYKEFNQKMGSLWKIKMVKHENISDDLVCVTYENGDKVLINYADTAVQYQNVTIEPKDYEVIGG